MMRRWRARHGGPLALYVAGRRELARQDARENGARTSRSTGSGLTDTPVVFHSRTHARFPVRATTTAQRSANGVAENPSACRVTSSNPLVSRDPVSTSLRALASAEIATKKMAITKQTTVANSHVSRERIKPRIRWERGFACSADANQRAGDAGSSATASAGAGVISKAKLRRPRYRAGR